MNGKCNRQQGTAVLVDKYRIGVRQARLNDCLQLSSKGALFSGRGSPFGHFETGAMGISARLSAPRVGG